MKLDMQPLNKRVFTTKGLKAVLVIIFTLSFGFGQITIVASGASGNEVNIGETYSQNFNGLIASGSGTYTDNSTIAGWYVNSEEMDSNADEYIAGTGSSTSGEVYSFGSSSASDRALGYLGSGGNDYFNLALRLVNSTGAAIDQITISYTGEQWRSGGTTNDNNNSLDFSWQIFSSGAGSLPQSTSLTNWTENNSFDFSAPVTSTASGALDGNNSTYRTSYSSVAITSMSWANGDELWIRWMGNDGTGADAGLAVDDFSVTAGIPSVTIGDESADAGWRMLCLPKTGGIVTDISDDTPVQGITGGDDASEDANFYYNDGSDESGTSDGWDEPTNVSTAWGDGLGFILYFFDNTNNGSSALPVTLDISGSEPGSDVTVDLTNTYTLVGNPFASNINLDDISGNDNDAGVQDGLTSPISVWSDADGSYTTYNYGESKIVSAWQGFFLERNSSSTSELTIPTSAKTSSAATISIFSKMMMTNRRTIELRLDAPNGNVDIANKFYFTEISHEGEDGFDGGKLLPLDGSPSLAFIQEFDGEERLLVQDARAYQPEEDQTCELAILDAGVSGEYQFSWPVMDNIPSDWEITLTDLETGAVVNMQEEEFYTFDIQNPIGQLHTDPLQPVTVDANAVYRNTVPARLKVTMSGFGLGSEDGSLPVEFALHPAYPNPFNPSTMISFDVPELQNVSVQIFNITGQLIETLINGKLESGEYEILWDAGNLPSGIYFVQLKSGNKTLNQKLTLLK